MSVLCRAPATAARRMRATTLRTSAAASSSSASASSSSLRQPRRGVFQQLYGFGDAPRTHRAGDWNHTPIPQRIKIFPHIGLGTWKSASGDAVRNAVSHALKRGYTHIDCAHVYGNHKSVADGIRDSGAVRSNLWLTSKLWNTEHEPSRVEAACRRALDELGTSYLDLFLMHWPVALAHTTDPATGEMVNYPRDSAGRSLVDDVPLAETWRAMERLAVKGLVKYIGVSNFSIAQMQEIMHPPGQSKPSLYRPFTNQIECHPYLPQKALRKWCAQNGIVVTAYSPLGSSAVDPATGKGIGPLHDPVVERVSTAMGCTPAQTLIRWSLQNGLHVIPKSTNADRIDENLRATTMQVSLLNRDQLDRLNALHTTLPPGTVRRFVNPVSFKEDGTPFFDQTADDA